MVRRFWFLSLIGLLLILGCVSAGKESFNLGQDLAKKNRLEEAIDMYKDALAKEPQNTEYMESLNKAKDSIAKRHLDKARSHLSQMPLTYDSVKAAYQEAEKALKYSPESKDSTTLVNKIKSEMEQLARSAEALYSDAVKAAEKNDWVGGVKKFKEISVFYPNYLDSAYKLKQAEEIGAVYYIKEAEKLEKAEDWEGVLKMLVAAHDMFPDRTDIFARLEAARTKHNPAYYLQKTTEYSKLNDWDNAMLFAQKAAAMGLDSGSGKQIATLKQQAARHYVGLCEQHLSGKKLYNAYNDMSKAVSYYPVIKTDLYTATVVGQLLSSMAEKAAAYDNQGSLGNAFVWYEKILSIDENYKDIFFKIQLLRDKLRARVVRKIAIMDFTPPSGNADAGRMVTDSLLSYLSIHAGNDVKILARDVLGAILKEIELGQAGLYDIESAKKAGKLQGTDVFIFGSVLNFNVDKNITESYKIDNVVVGKKTLPNPAYQMWLMSLGGKNPTDEDLRKAPPATTDEELRETVKYKVGTEKKRANVAISFRVIDIEQGEVVITKTIKKNLEIKDDYSEGVAFANIKFDPLEIMSDSELLEKVTQEAVSELSHEVLSRFENLQAQYFDIGETYKKKREYEKAVEKYSDAIHLENLKNISSPLSGSAKKEIEQMLKQIAM